MRRNEGNQYRMSLLGASDPMWAIQTKERSRYEEQFRALNPDNGVVTGEQAKGFFLQSQLPPSILGQIWALSDTDSDGRMNINEFSIACKLINLRLRGYQLPTTLPPVLKNIENQFPAMDGSGKSFQMNILQTANVSKVPTTSPQSVLTGIKTGNVGSPTDSNSTGVTMISRPSLTSSSSVTQTMGMITYGQPGLIQNILETSNFPIPSLQSQAASTQVIPPALSQCASIGLHSSTAIQSCPITTPAQSGVSTCTPVTPSVLPIAQSVPSVESIKIVEKGQQVIDQSSVGSPVSEWAVPHQSKLKYTQLFNTTDRVRTGFLSGLQAKTILVQTNLPQAVLAQIWALVDSDSDGRINCEEFVLAMHLCDMAKEGHPLPTTLPYELVPPALRRKRGNSFSVSDDKSDLVGIQNNVTFEDKRKENFDKGQVELERRRAILLEAQRKEQEEREKKEREEQEKREAQRAEQEAKRQQELQKQLQRQREVEMEQEEQKRRLSEQREAARKELERQRQLEWEKARTQELEGQRMKEQTNVLKLKAKNQSLAIELATLTGKVKELSVKISETRTGVSAVKATIDGMRNIRDTHMSEMSTLKSKLKEQNQRLLLLAQEKARLEARNKVSGLSNSAATEQIMLAFTNKQITIKHLNEKLADLQNEVKAKTKDVENNNILLRGIKTQLSDLVDACETIYATYSEKRDAILQLKADSSANSGWRISSNHWETSPSSWSALPDNPANWDSSASLPADDHLKKYRALYKFDSRNPDELSFQPGDIISVSSNQCTEPGWLAGELRGMRGWFPEAYVELLETDSIINPVEDVNNSQVRQPLEGILELPESINDNTPRGGTGERYMALYRYQSTEIGDLNFEQGEIINVIKKDGAWWTGNIGERTGLFPSNYVEKVDSESEGLALPSISDDKTSEDDSVFVQAHSDEKKPNQSKSPLPTSSASGRETPADFEQNKPVTPDFSTITAAQTKISKKGEVATVIAPYQATSSEQLSLARGQLVCIRKKTTTGWWEGELQAKGKKKQIGWFPASYVKLMASRRLSQTTPDLETEQNIEKVIAMFPYKALNEDELSFEKDDLITVLAKEELTWWRGELKGSTGLFPSNYVMPLDGQSQKYVLEEKLRQDAIRELLESERSYTSDMSLVRQVFEKPLSKSGLITRHQLQMIFLNWREILRGNHALLKLLEERMSQSRDGTIESVGDILCDNLPRMRPYVKFCSSQLNAGAVLQQLTDSSPAFRELCRQCQRDPRTQGLPLSTFLVKPMQRITKYPLLIAKVLEHTPPLHPDRRHLEEALFRAEKLCSEVNEGVRENENSDRLEWLQSHVSLEGLQEELIFNSLTNSLGRRKFLYHGVLVKARSGRELVGFLLSDFLLLAQPLKPLAGQFSMDKMSPSVDLKLYKKILLVKDISVQKSGDSDRAFAVVTPKGQLNFVGSTSGETVQWVKNISMACEQYRNSLEPSHFSRFLRSDDGLSEGRLLVEVVEAYNLQVKSSVCIEVRLNNQVQYTPPVDPSFKWHCSMQFLVHDTQTDLLLVGILVKYDLRPNDMLDRGEVRVREIFEQTRTGGPVLRKLALRKLGNAEILLKLDLVLFNLG